MKSQKGPVAKKKPRTSNKSTRYKKQLERCLKILKVMTKIEIEAKWLKFRNFKIRQVI